MQSQSFGIGQQFPIQIKESCVKGEIYTQQNGQFQAKKASWVWPKGVVLYRIDESFTQDMRIKLQQAIKAIEQNAPLKFQQLAGYKESDYVLFQRSKDGRSYTNGVGFNQGTKHDVFINFQSEQGVYIHEIMHILGFHHEQQRMDRDQYLIVKQSNNNQKDYQNQIQGHMLGRYDSDSIMHYPEGELIQTKQQQKIGQGKELSEGDKEALKALYGPGCSYNNAFPSKNRYYCLTCWGKQENSICHFCAINCHGDHDIKKLDKKGTDADCFCGLAFHQATTCAKVLLNNQDTQHPKLICFDCFDYSKYNEQNYFQGPGICIVCYYKCHKNHNIYRYYKISSFDCNCPSNRCQTISK